MLLVMLLFIGSDESPATDAHTFPEFSWRVFVHGSALIDPFDEKLVLN